MLNTHISTSDSIFTQAKHDIRIFILVSEKSYSATIVHTLGLVRCFMSWTIQLSHEELVTRNKMKKNAWVARMAFEYWKENAIFNKYMVAQPVVISFYPDITQIGSVQATAYETPHENTHISTVLLVQISVNRRKSISTRGKTDYA